MATASTTFANGTLERQLGRTLAIYFKEAKYEFLTRLRLRAYSISTISFPLMFYVLFGLVLNPKGAPVGGTTITTYLIPTYGTFGVMGASLFGTASGLAAERGLGWLQVKRASPMPPFAYFAAKVALGMIFSTVVVVLLLTLGSTFGGVHMPLMDAAKLVAILVALFPSARWDWPSATSWGRIRRWPPLT
jgi:ABC-2 type transport system permease protein